MGLRSTAWNADDSSIIINYAIPFSQMKWSLVTTTGWFSSNSITVAEIISSTPDNVNYANIDSNKQIAIMQKNIYTSTGLSTNGSASIFWASMGV